MASPYVIKEFHLFWLPLLFKLGIFEGKKKGKKKERKRGLGNRESKVATQSLQTKHTAILPSQCIQSRNVTQWFAANLPFPALLGDGDGTLNLYVHRASKSVPKKSAWQTDW